ncbi:MAG TPA: 23S rRNA (adenine(2503)-C(2))-methyltransferase RlmN [Acidimicrobiia bacterium]|jgi:23S rRNA (adenine2503-C2)-methyltransferase
MTTSRYGASAPEVEKLVRSFGEPAYRARQVWDALYRRAVPLEAATDLPGRLREQLADALPLALRPVVDATSADGATRKWLWVCDDRSESGAPPGEASRAGAEATRRRDAQIETVLMEYPDRATVCVSSQAGCAMGCTFCATGQEGFERHLDAGEVVEQVLRAAHASERRVSNVVYMGMGEPLANYDAVWTSVERLHDALGLSARHLTVSTVGVVPGMRRLARERLPVTLAVSVHAPDDELRSTLVPLNRRYPLGEVLDAAAEVAAARGRRVTFEYALIRDVNDRADHAERLARLLTGARLRGGAHVNVIPLNPTAGFDGRGPAPTNARAFAARLEAGGVRATVRRNRGADIDAACGQLRARELAGS